jgi:hypothetical protein
MWCSFTDVHNLTLLLRLNIKLLLVGTHLECMSALVCLGISLNNIPVAEDGTMNLDYCHNWLEERRRLEESSSEKSTTRADEGGRKRKKSRVRFGT